MNSTVRCALAAVGGAGFGYWAARTVLERNYAISVANAFHDARGYNGPGYRKQVKVTVGGELVQMAEYEPLKDEETGEPYPAKDKQRTTDASGKEYAGVEKMDVRVAHPVHVEPSIEQTRPKVVKAYTDYAAISRAAAVDSDEVAQQQHYREEFIDDLNRKLRGVPEEDPVEDVYGKSPLSGGDGTPDMPVVQAPYSITDGDFAEGMDGYGSTMLVYYAGDHVVVEPENNNRVMDYIDAIQALGPFENLPFDASDTLDPDTCYMRCPQNRMDYEVVRSEGNYSDTPPFTGGNG